jgi:hypothetical protein
MRTMMVMGAAGIFVFAAFAAKVCAEENWTTLTVIEEVGKGKTTVVDLGGKGDSQGDITAWHEPLVDRAKKNIGTSSGFCIRMVPGQLSECQWTLTLREGTITLAGSEAEKGTSRVSVTGGTGVYAGVSGEAAVTHNADGTYTEILKLKKKKR